ncbi:hypothetical protein AALO_G00097840 [Alosa alosa]|uniref:Thioredoxin domain-containing protein n=1 Tax=Alosa alosa TaxID=278164 RepID=A0AAV6GTY1_9TELE|nr:hypothetical protein AALO_G00097840 [Alosa alosa]
MLRRSRVYLRQVVNLMARRPDLLCGAILLSVLLILAVKFTCRDIGNGLQWPLGQTDLQNKSQICQSRAKNVVAQAPAPVRFFAADAPVVDLYLGQLEQVERLRALAEVSLVFFYAPWCAHSVAAHDQLQHVAQRLGHEVLFVAVNCWWNQGKCRRQKNFYQYPVIHIYYRRFGPIEYKGPFTALYVERFIQKVVTPLTYLPSRDILEDFLSYHETGVVGFFEFNSSPQPPGYITFLSSALQALKRDFQGVVRFGVVTNRRVAEAISVQEDETVYLHRHFNSSLIFPRWERNFTAENICSWVFQHRESLLPWVPQTGAKSRILEQELRKGPALLLFLPHDPLAANHPLQEQIAEIAVRYHSCPEDLISQYTKGGVGVSRVPVGPLCCNTLVLPGWSSVSGSAQNVCELCLNRSVGPAAVASANPASPDGGRNGIVDRGGDRGARGSHRCSVLELEAALESYLRHLSVSGGRLTPHAHTHTPPALLAPTCSNVRNTYNPFSHYSACCGPLLAKTGNRTRASSDESQESRVSPSEPANASATAAADDCPGNNSDRTFAAIVDLQDETHYVLDHRGRLMDTLEPFIENFSTPHSHLKRHLVGDKRPQPPQSFIQEVTTDTFLDIVMDPKRDVLLLYYTNWCGFCSVLNHVLLQLARLLQSNRRFIVARVNVASNDLPWEFMVDHFPSILLFPRHRKQLSVKFARPRSLLEAQVRALRGEVRVLHRAHGRLSRQLAGVWRERRALVFQAQALAAENGELRRRGDELEERRREKSRELADAVGRLRELADASRGLLAENTVLKVLLAALRERGGGGGGGGGEGGDEEEGVGGGGGGGDDRRETDQEGGRGGEAGNREVS